MLGHRYEVALVTSQLRKRIVPILRHDTGTCMEDFIQSTLMTIFNHILVPPLLWFDMPLGSEVLSLLRTYSFGYPCDDLAL